MAIKIPVNQVMALTWKVDILQWEGVLLVLSAEYKLPLVGFVDTVDKKALTRLIQAYQVPGNVSICSTMEPQEQLKLPPSYNLQ